MKKGITQFIPENIPPSNAVSLAIYDGDNKICNVDISKMQPNNIGEPLYSFGLISDTHLKPNAYDGPGYWKKLKYAFDLFAQKGVNFIAHCGDITDHGYFLSDRTTGDPDQFGQYREIRETYPDIPIYAACGNHDSYFGDITKSADLLKIDAGHGIFFSVVHDDDGTVSGEVIENDNIAKNDIFIFIGQTASTIPVTLEQLATLNNILSSNPDKRCFVFVHSYVDNLDSGNLLEKSTTSLFNSYASRKANFINYLKNHKKLILFHGHSHIHPSQQIHMSNINYSTVLGFNSFHVPSLSYCRHLSKSGAAIDEDQSSSAYICDVYANHIVLRAYDIPVTKDNSGGNPVYNEDGKPIISEIPIAQYCIDTTTQPI